MNNFTPPTEAELNDIAVQLLPRDVPYSIGGVSHTQLSIARYYGGINFNSHHYTYFPDRDELWRDDVLRAVEKMRKQAKKAAPVETSQHQEQLL